MSDRYMIRCHKCGFYYDSRYIHYCTMEVNDTDSKLDKIIELLVQISKKLDNKDIKDSK